MKKLLSILATFALCTTTSINVVACGGQDFQKEPADPIDISSLLTLAQNKIQDAFGKLIGKYENLIYENQIPNDKGTEISNEIANAATNQIIINDDIKTEIIKGLLNDQKLTPLFSGIQTNDILKLNKQDSSLMKKDFKWKKSDNVDFGVANYDEKTYC